MFSFITVAALILTSFHLLLSNQHGVHTYGLYHPGHYKSIPSGLLSCGPGSYYIATDVIGTGDHLTKATQVIRGVWDIHTARGYISALEWNQDIQLFNNIIMWQFIAETKSLWIHFRKFLSENLDGDSGKSIDTLSSWFMIQSCTKKPGDSDIYYRSADKMMPPTYIVGYYENHAHDNDGLKNEWHYGQITASADDTSGKLYTYTNGGGLSWSLTLDHSSVIGEGEYRFHVGPECPYFKNGYTSAIMMIDDNGEYFITGPGYEMFTLASGHVMPGHWTEYNFENSIIFHLPLFYIGGWYENREYESGDKNDFHYVHITAANHDEPDGLTYTWSNEAGVSWTMTIDVLTSSSEKIVFHVGEDCVYYIDGYVTAVLTAKDHDYIYITGPSNEKYDVVSNNVDKPEGWGDKYGVYTQSDDNHLRA